MIMKKNLKIIQLIDSLTPGGAEMMAVNIANGLGDDHIKSYLCATRKEGDLKQKIGLNVGYLFLKKKKVIDLSAIRMLNTYIKNQDINIVHAHSSSYFMGFIIKLLNPKISLIWHNHNGNSEELELRKRIPLFFISRYFNAVISVNKSLHNWAINYLKAKNGYYLANFGLLSNGEIKKTVLFGNVGKRVVCLANLRLEKNHLNLLKAFSIILEKHQDWSLHLVGLDLFDDYSKEIKLFIKRKQQDDNVFIYGTCSDIKNILSQATIGVLSSNSEGLPVALIEYGLAKLPVVVTNVGECGTVVNNNVTGLVVPSKNEVALSNAILQLMVSVEFQKLFGDKFHDSIVLHYSHKVYLSKLTSIYKIV